MATRGAKEAIVILWDIKNSLADDGDKFFEKSQACINMIIQRKIFSKSKDEVGLILLGSENTANRLDYDNISVAFTLGFATFDMLEQVTGNIKPSNVTADWLDGLVVGLDFMKDRTEGKKLTAKKIVLFSKFSMPACDDQVDIIIRSMKDDDIQLVVIGPDILADMKQELDDTKEEMEENGINGYDEKKFKPEAALILRIVSEVDGVICSFDDAIPQLMFYQKKSVNPYPWNVDLEIGSKIKIPVSGYRKISDEPAVSSWKMTAATAGPSGENEQKHVQKEVSYFNQDETQSSVEKEDIIHGYSFGSTIVPFSDTDQAAMNYKSGPRCLQVLGFTSVKRIPRHIVMGVGTYYFFARNNEKPAEMALSALITALHELQRVALVRRIYNNNNAPKLGILSPRIKDTQKCLLYVELPFSEDMREYVFPTLSKVKDKLTKPQLDAVSSFIDSMDLMSADSDGGEAFKPKKMLNPHQQYGFWSLAYRALHPGEPVPPPPASISKLLTSPFESDNNCKEKLKHVSSLFSLQEVVRKQPRKAAADIFKQSADDVPEDVEVDDTKQALAQVVSRNVIEVGTVTPEEDFMAVLKSGESFVEVCKQMQNVIINLVTHSFGDDDFGKAESALKFLREKCLEVNPAVFNEWMLKFKDMVLSQNNSNFWKLVTEGNIGLITTDENVSSTVSAHEASDFLQVKADTTASTQEKQVDVDDLFDEM